VPPFNDVRVRQALNYAIDKDQITKSLFPNGLATPAPCQLGREGEGDVTPGLKPYPYDLNKAKQLIKAAGATGAKVEMDWTSDIYPLDREVGQAVAQELNQAGLKVQLKLLNNTEFQKEVFTTGKDAAQITGTGTTDTYGSETRLTNGYYLSDGSNPAIADAKLDTLFNKANASKVGPEREAAFAAGNKYACDISAVGYLYNFKELYGSAKNIDYVPTGPITRPNFQDIKVLATGN
jgi:peptide/nickel transport system substrate-binding protein